MNPQELRIGNLLRDTLAGALLEVEYISAKSFSVKVLDRSKFPLPEGWEAVPIPLTTDLLLQFGFVAERYSTFTSYVLGYFEFYVFGDRGSRTLYRNGIIHMKMPDYVHQLQNLYFAMENEELPTPVLLR